MDTALLIDIFSFSYKNGIPEDRSGNGGGFVFDCRGILNPGRIDEYKTLSGKDFPVQEFLEIRTQMPVFLNLIQKMVSITVQDYVSRGFSHLQIAFGCTGGQHRSVYAAENLAKFIAENFAGTSVKVTHSEQQNWKKA